jgi:hypothetical protein
MYRTQLWGVFLCKHSSTGLRMEGDLIYDRQFAFVNVLDI